MGRTSNPAAPLRARYFASPAGFRAWLTRHHLRAIELWVGFHKRHTGRPSLTWSESVDEALCFGWIDGVRRSVDADRYVIRFTPRKSGSKWSAINVRKVAALTKQGRMAPAGLRAFAARDGKRAGYSYEDRPQELPARYAKRLRDNRRAWEYYQAQPPGYRRTAAFWVTSAKKEETRLRRLAALIADSAAGRRIQPLARRPS